MSLRLYTSRYSNREIENTNLVPVGITLGNPRFKLAYKLHGIRKELAPPTWNIMQLPRDRFQAQYEAHLTMQGVPKLRALLQGIQDKYRTADGLVLLCYEDLDKGDFCHRRMFAEWWEREAGEPVEELQPAVARLL